MKRLAKLLIAIFGMTTKAQLKFTKCSDDGSLNKENF